MPQHGLQWVFLIVGFFDYLVRMIGRQKPAFVLAKFDGKQASTHAGHVTGIQERFERNYSQAYNDLGFGLFYVFNAPGAAVILSCHEGSRSLGARQFIVLSNEQFHS